MTLVQQRHVTRTWKAANKKTNEVTHSSQPSHSETPTLDSIVQHHFGRAKHMREGTQHAIHLEDKQQRLTGVDVQPHNRLERFHLQWVFLRI